jgi:hypothetical protein
MDYYARIEASHDILCAAGTPGVPSEADIRFTSGMCQERSFVCLHIRTPRLVAGEVCREANLSSTVDPSGVSGCAMVVPQDDRLARAMHRGAIKVERP